MKYRIVKLQYTGTYAIEEKGWFFWHRYDERFSCAKDAEVKVKKWLENQKTVIVKTF